MAWSNSWLSQNIIELACNRLQLSIAAHLEHMCRMTCDGLSIVQSVCGGMCRKEAATTSAPASNCSRLAPLTMDQMQFEMLPRNQRTFVYNFGPGFRVKVNNTLYNTLWSSYLLTTPPVPSYLYICT